MKAGKLSLLLLTPLFLLGCAVGNQYSYKAESVGLPLDQRNKEISVGVGVEDNRPYILDGSKPPTFVGLQRGGFGNPFNVTTASNRPFAEDVAEILSDMLQRYGYMADLESSSDNLDAFSRDIRKGDYRKGIFLNIKEWKTDIYASVTLHYNLELSILDKNGNVVATSSQVGSEPIGGMMISESANAAKASQSLAIKLSYLFADPGIQSAMD